MPVIVGIGLEMLAATLGTVSKQLIAYSNHVDIYWIFLLGAFLNTVVGPAFDASAYLFAPQIVVAPFASLDVLLNAATAPYTMSYQKEKRTLHTLAATLMVALGATLTAVFGAVHDVVATREELEAKLMRPLTFVYVAFEGMFVFTIYHCLELNLIPTRLRGLALGVSAGLSMGNVFFIKGFLLITRLCVSTHDWSSFLRPMPYVLFAGAACGAVLGHIFMKWGLREFTAIYMITIIQGAHISAVSLSGCLIMQEMADTSWVQYLRYGFSVCFIIAGIVLINQSVGDATLRAKDKEKSAAEPDEEDAFAKKLRRNGKAY
mmetsp:Transcript_81275/g.159540  ORF Transcript_81275/g.159540 Transcript_81275/m.159540 type:complete len:319 (+) Transcript_81275:92-1048(+)|eukprot:CAMPEP_0170255738 /NCGR_PEP_ID=MMETSP0116_2-20130129/27722_1 /TAXON_ID=400756 /ORGANISM="Durinskia baltica, Strain CSIRO CS-38" /LENGTH=318 /DNA_ID=CAMNT_0010506747 /DNA_START=82 /DNA_END=1038 /DNA_ORIENTATION=+